MENSGKLDTALDAVESIAEIVEDVAETVDKVADEVAGKLPDGSKFKEAICMLDQVAEGAVKGADLVEELVQKVEEVEEKLETLGEKRKVSEVK